MININNRLGKSIFICVINVPLCTEDFKILAGNKMQIEHTKHTDIDMGPKTSDTT